MIGIVLIVVLIGLLKDRRDIFGLEDPIQPPSAIHEVVENSGNLEQLWSRSTIFVRPDYIGLLMDASEGMLFILGSLTQTEPETILAFNSGNGEILWQGGSGTESALNANSSALYVGSSGLGRVTAYNLHSGQVSWSERLSNTRSVRRIYIFDDLLQVSASFENFLLLRADSGEIVQRFNHKLEQDFFLIIDQIMFVQQPTLTVLQAIDLQTDSLIWEADVEQAYYQGPVFTADVILIRTRRHGLGSVYAIDRRTGSILWRTKEDIISNLAATDSIVYALTLDGKLLGLNLHTGEEVASVKFDPSPFAINEPGTPVVGGYHVAADNDEGLVYVTLGDSAQLFAFRIVDLNTN